MRRATFQLLCQAAGRGGRGEKPGEAVIQTYHPDHYSIQAAAVQNYEAFYEEEMSYRTLMDYPPAAHMMAVLGSSPSDEILVQAMHYLKLYIQRIYKEKRPSCNRTGVCGSWKSEGYLQTGDLFKT